MRATSTIALDVDVDVRAGIRAGPGDPRGARPGLVVVQLVCICDVVKKKTNDKM